MRTTAVAFLALSFAGLGVTYVHADEFGCTGNLAAYANISFEHQTHRLWYVRFWTGQCAAGLDWCFSGTPYWGETMQRTLGKVPQANRAAATQRLCEVGRRVGREWARDNDIRRIDTNLVHRWINRLEAAADPMRELDAIDAEAKQRLGQ